MDLNQPMTEQQNIDPLTLRSTSNQDISNTPELFRSLLFAELSMLAYLPHNQAMLAAPKLGFTEIDFFDKEGTQAYAFANHKDIVIACRGTEAGEWNDLKADINVAQALAETVGRVHRGFKKEVDDLWPMLEKKLERNHKNLWFTGHSLGGAMATICAGRCLFSKINTSPIQIQTFGSPRVGNKRYINHAKVDYIRWVNNNDIVTRSPPIWMGYRHTGKEIYLDSEGQIKNFTKIQRNKDMWKGFISGLKKNEIDLLSDHAITRYIEYIFLEAKKTGE